MGNDELSSLLSGYDAGLPSRRLSDSALGSEMRLRLFILAAFVALWVVPIFGQGCAMCYSNATGTTKEGQRAISRGVLVLLIPPVGFMTLGVGMAFRYGKKRDEDLGRT